MAVHFDFILSDVEAETLIDCVTMRIFECDRYIDDPLYTSEGEWFREHQQFLQNLKLKMTNTRIGDEQNDSATGE